MDRVVVDPKVQEKLLVGGRRKAEKRVPPFECSGFTGAAAGVRRCRRRAEFLSIRTGDEEEEST